MTPQIRSFMIVGGLCFVGGQAFGQDSGVCAPTLEFPSVIHTRPYDPFASTPLIEDVIVSYRDGQCATPAVVNTTIGWAGASPKLAYNNNFLRFALLLGGNDLTSLSTSQTRLTEPLSGGAIAVPQQAYGTLSLQTRLVLPEGQIVPPGYYRFFLPGVETSNSGLLTQTAEQTSIRATDLSIATQVLAVMNIGVTGCDLSTSSGRNDEGALAPQTLASACTLNLGDPGVGMREGNSKRARINARANVPFKLAMTSQNGGFLSLAGQSASPKPTEIVAYSATLDGDGVTSVFSCGGVICGSSDTIQPSLSPLGSDLYFSVRVTDSNLSQKRAGTYADTITLTIQPAS